MVLTRACSPPFPFPSLPQAFLRDVLCLGHLPFTEKEWTKEQCVAILEGVVERAPQYAHVPLDLRTRQAFLGASSSTTTPPSTSRSRCASMSLDAGGDEDDDDNENSL